MTENDGELEQLLRGLPRRMPSAELDRRIAGSVAPHSSRRQRPVWSTAAAASVVLVIGAGLWVAKARITKSIGPKATVATTIRTSPGSVPHGHGGGTGGETGGGSGGDVPIEFSRTTSQTIDDGIVVDPDGVPYRQYRRETVQDYWWVDPTTGARARITVPTEQLMVCPEQTY